MFLTCTYLSTFLRILCRRIRFKSLSIPIIYVRITCVFPTTRHLTTSCLLSSSYFSNAKPSSGWQLEMRKEKNSKDSLVRMVNICNILIVLILNVNWKVTCLFRFSWAFRIFFWYNFYANRSLIWNWWDLY